MTPKIVDAARSADAPGALLCLYGANLVECLVEAPQPTSAAGIAASREALYTRFLVLLFLWRSDVCA